MSSAMTAPVPLPKVPVVAPQCNQSLLQINSLSLDVVTANLSALRPDVKYEIIGGDEACKGGCFNLHFPITFEDGVKWILRVRQFNKYGKISPDDHWYGVECEATTLQTMFGSGMRTVSNAYLPPTRASVTPGYDTAHFYCDFMPGEEMLLEGSTQPEAWEEGIRASQPMHHIFGYGPHLGVSGDLDEARKFMASFADHMIGISNLPFSGFGQLTRNQSGKVEVGPMAQQATSPGPWRLGPCQSLQEVLFGYWDEQFAVSNVQGRWRLRSYLSLLDRKRLIRSYGSLAKDPNTTFIKHPDEAIMQYFTDKGRLSAVLDWEWAYTTVKGQAFMAPKAFMPDMGRDRQTSEEIDTLSREEELLIEAYEAKGRPDLADCVRSGPVYRLLDIDHQQSFRTIQSVTRFRRTFGRGIEDLTFPKTIEDWQAECLEIFRDDPGLAMFSAEDRTPWPKTPPGPQKMTAEMRAAAMRWQLNLQLKTADTFNGSSVKL